MEIFRESIKILEEVEILQIQLEILVSVVGMVAMLVVM